MPKKLVPQELLFIFGLSNLVFSKQQNALSKYTKVFISLGSNLGDRWHHLQEAIDQIYQKIGLITQVSQVYETPAWGFEGSPFLNACIEIETIFSAEKCLKELLEIELELGRTRLPNGEYSNRSIDLDILFYGDESRQSEILIIPHPKLTERDFVLAPLKDIAPNFRHPKLGTQIIEYFNKFTSPSIKIVDDLKLKIPQLPIIQYQYLAIEGNIGAGKTSLASCIAHDYNAKFIPERFKDNPFLPKFYKDQSRYAFPLEMSFLADRHQQLLDDISQFELFSEFAVADYDFYKSLIFAQVTLGEDEYRLYKKVFDIMYKELPKPDAYIYLYQNTERLLSNIKKRGRGYEQEIQPEYLENLNKGYLNFIKNQQFLKVEIIDISELDFVENRKDYLYLLEEIAGF